jgi:hypothetical protein
VSTLTSPKTYAALSAFHAGDAVACAVPLPLVTKFLDQLDVPVGIRWIFPTVKTAAAVGLLSVFRFPGLARLTTAMLTVYFALAVGAHVRVHDKPIKIVPPASFLAMVAIMTVKGPDRR